MNFWLCSVLVFFRIIVLYQVEGETEIGDYIIDCSACNYLPLQGVDSYRCNVRCEAQGEPNLNLTSLYDILTQMLTRQTAMEEKLQQTERKLNETLEKLKIDVAFTVHLSSRQTFNVGEVILFDRIVSNVGNGYDSAPGIFTAPHNGTYDLTLTSMTVQNAQMYTRLVINGQIICTSHGFNTHLQGMCTVNRKMVEGDQVWAQAWDTIQYNYNGFSSLSGHLVHLD